MEHDAAFFYGIYHERAAAYELRRLCEVRHAGDGERGELAERVGQYEVGAEAPVDVLEGERRAVGEN